MRSCRGIGSFTFPSAPWGLNRQLQGRKCFPSLAETCCWNTWWYSLFIWLLAFEGYAATDLSSALLAGANENKWEAERLWPEKQQSWETWPNVQQLLNCLTIGLREMPHNRDWQAAALPDSPSKGSSTNSICEVLQALSNKQSNAPLLSCGTASPASTPRRTVCHHLQGRFNEG